MFAPGWVCLKAFPHSQEEFVESRDGSFNSGLQFHHGQNQTDHAWGKGQGQESLDKVPLSFPGGTAFQATKDSFLEGAFNCFIH